MIIFIPLLNFHLYKIKMTNKIYDMTQQLVN